jgi:hypothetical protein
MALMTAVTILFAIVADFLLLPPLLMAVDGSKHEVTASDRSRLTAVDGKEQIDA